MTLVGKITGAAGKAAVKKFLAKEAVNVSKNVDFTKFEKFAHLSKSEKVAQIPKIEKMIDTIDLPKVPLWKKILSVVAKTKGLKGGFTLTAEELKYIHLPNAKAQKTLVAFLKRARNPEVTVAFKSNSKGSGFKVAAVKLMDGKSVVGTGAISMTKPNAADNVIKARLSLGRKSKAVCANGFVDGSKSIDTLADDVALATSRKAGVYSVNSRLGDTVGWNLRVAPQDKEFLRVASYTGEKKAVQQHLGVLPIKAEKVNKKINDLFKKYMV